MMGMMGRGEFRRFPMMGGFGGLRMFVIMLCPLALAFLAGIGVASLIHRSPRPAPPVCPNCKHVVQRDWTACPYCGTSLAPAAPVEPPTEPPAAD
jgi:hypothetical protein